MNKQGFLGTIGWIKGNLMSNPNLEDKNYNNENFHPGAENIPESNPTRLDGVPPVTDGLVLCYDGNNHGDYGVGNMWGASWLELATNTTGYVSTQGDTTTPKLTNSSGETCYEKWFTDDYGTYCYLDKVETRGIIASIDLPNPEHTFIMLIRKQDSTSHIKPCTMINDRNIYSQFSYPNTGYNTYTDGVSVGYYRTSLRGDNQGTSLQTANFLFDGAHTDTNKPVLIANITKHLGNNSFMSTAWFDNKSNTSGEAYSSTAGKFTGDIRFGGYMSGSTSTSKCYRHLYACYFYNRALTDVEYAKVKDYISKRYNLSL